VRELRHWQARGKVAYSLPQDGGSANLIWDQAGNQSELNLSGPLGAGSTRVRNDGPLISVRRDGIERRYPADAAPWLPSGTLMPIPLTAIHYWLRGIPDPERPVDELSTEGGLARTIRQEGWLVVVDEYHADAPAPLPKRLRIEAAEVGLSLRTYLRQWDLAEP
jgi:outer membrane lipoprotein LolB